MSSPLPFLKDKPQTSIATESRKTEEMSPMEAVASDLLKAIESKNIKAIADALQNAQELADMMPHEEGSHE